MEEEQKRNEEALKKRLLAGARQAMQTPEGRELMRFIIAESRFFVASCEPRSVEFLNYWEGRRAIGAQLYRLLSDADPKNIVKLMEREDV